MRRNEIKTLSVSAFQCLFRLIRTTAEVKPGCQRWFVYAPVLVRVRGQAHAAEDAAVDAVVSLVGPEAAPQQSAPCLSSRCEEAGRRTSRVTSPRRAYMM